MPGRGPDAPPELKERRRVAKRVALLQAGWGVIVNFTGAGLAYVFLSFVFTPEDDNAGWLNDALSLAILAGYLLVVSPLATLRLARKARPLREWARSDRPATKVERRIVLGLPGMTARSTAVFWVGGALLFGAINLQDSFGRGVEVFGTVLLVAVMTTAAEFLGTERIMRPAVALVLSRNPPSDAGSLGIGPRLLVTWLLCAAVPLVAMALVPLGRIPDNPRELAIPLAFIAGLAILAGGIAMTFAVRAVTVPVRRVRKAMDAVAEGDLEVEVDVDDASEVGRLEAGFNHMVDGLRERERLRDLFGRQVGADVAREALERGIELGGQTRHISALFIDVVGSTALAARERPERVVELLNEFFTMVVDVVERHRGLVNKFEGDAALCIFGAPVTNDEHAACALRAARELASRLRRHDAFDAAVGVSSGEAVAGNVGTERRFEYTVIGDPVNEAARLTELAKEEDCRVLAADAILRAAGEEEAARWELGEEVVLRGREQPTRLARPA